MLNYTFSLRSISMVFVLACMVLTSGCSLFRSKNPPIEKVMRMGEAPKNLSDDLPLEPLREGIAQSIQRLKEREDIVNLQFGSLKLSKEAYIHALDLLAKEIDRGADKEQLLSFIAEHFDFYEVYGNREWGEVFMTSYYNPLIEGSKVKTERFSRALYTTPDNLVTIDYQAFLETFPNLDKENARKEQKTKGAVLRGRLVPGDGGASTAKVVPFYSREEIDGGEAPVMANSKVIAWVDPIESFFMQIQGSGTIQFQDGSRIRLSYASQNGHSYVAIGRHLLDIIPKEKMSLQEIEKHLRSVSIEERDRILNLNPSYVFFQELDSKALTYFGTEVVSGRTIATDRHYFPKGALAYLQFEKPIFANLETHEPDRWQPSSRIVIDSDTGGAIRGPGRLDLFWGEGQVGEQTAGIMKNYGKLSYLVPNEKLLKRKIEVKTILQ